MRTLVTGGAGRLGIRLSQALLQDGFNVRIFDLNNAETRKNVKHVMGKVEIYWGDITNPESVSKALENIDTVIHMAAVLTAITAVNPELATRVNVGGTRILIDMIKRKEISIPLIYTSSVAVFGPTPNVSEPLSPDRDIANPKGSYAETKLQAENLIKASGIEYVILRLGTFWQDLVFSIDELKYMYRIPLDNRIEICHPLDMCLAIINSIKKFSLINGKTFIISGGPDCRMLHQDRVSAIMEVLGLPVPPAEKFSRQAAPMDWYDTQEVQELLQFQQRTLVDSIADYKRELNRRYYPIFPFTMRYFVGPIFGKLIVQLI